MYPLVQINTEKLRENTKVMREIFSPIGISLMGVTKSFCAIPEIAEVLVEGGQGYLADARIANLKKLSNIKAPKVLLRIPMHSEVKQVVEYADYSLNSELSTLQLLGSAAIEKGKIHKVIIMLDLGDLREGVWADQINDFIEQAIKIKGIEIRGFGVNLTCYGGVIPDEINLGRLSSIADEMKKKYKLTLDIVSGGNSSSVYLAKENRFPKGINNLRLGEVLMLGKETAFGESVEGLNEDVFTLKGQIVEVKEKPSMPIGNIGRDAFGNKPTYIDKGIMKRAIIAMGRQDIEIGGLIPLDRAIGVIGASSDHTILDVSKCDKVYNVGDLVEFYMNYGCLLKAMTSEYVEKVIV